MDYPAQPANQTKAKPAAVCEGTLLAGGGESKKPAPLGRHRLKAEGWEGQTGGGEGLSESKKESMAGLALGISVWMERLPCFLIWIAIYHLGAWA